VAFSAEIIGGSMKLLIHHDARWVNINQLDQFDFCPADIAVVNKILGEY